MLNQAVKYGLVGIVNTLTDFLLFSLLLYGLACPLLIANSVAFSIAVLQSYYINRHWTFAEQTNSINARQSAKQLIAFVAMNLVGLCISNLTVYWLAEQLTPLGAKLAATGLVFTWGFSISKLIIFKNSGREVYPQEHP